jgi:hypothetical protein
VELGTLALRYVPFLAMLFVAAIVLFDARVRLRRPGRGRLFPPVQLLLAIGMMVLATVAIVVSPEVGLLEVTSATLQPGAFHGTLSTYVIAGLVAAVTLVAGLAWPARPHPRRGLTIIALVADVAAVIGSSFGANGMLPILGM